MIYRLLCPGRLDKRRPFGQIKAKAIRQPLGELLGRSPGVRLDLLNQIGRAVDALGELRLG